MVELCTGGDRTTMTVSEVLPCHAKEGWISDKVAARSDAGNCDKSWRHAIWRSRLAMKTERNASTRSNAPRARWQRRNGKGGPVPSFHGSDAAGQRHKLGPSMRLCFGIQAQRNNGIVSGKNRVSPSQGAAASCKNGPTSEKERRGDEKGGGDMRSSCRMDPCSCMES